MQRIMSAHSRAVNTPSTVNISSPATFRRFSAASGRRSIGASAGAGADDDDELDSDDDYAKAVDFDDDDDVGDVEVGGDEAFY